MSHPERLGASGGGQVSTIAEPPHMNGNPPLAEFAARHGLKQSAARPPLRAYIRQLWQRRHFIWAFASAKSVAMYTESRLGQLWQVLTPLLNALVYYLIFGLLLGRSGDVSKYIPYLVTGIFFFHFTQRSVTSGAKSVQSSMSLIRALHFPRATLPFSYTIVELQQLFAAMGVLLVIMLGFQEWPTWEWVLIVPILLLQLMFNIGVSLVVARIGAFVPDLSQLLPFILRTWLYFSGIMFSMYTLSSKVPTWAMRLMEANPGSVYVELARRSLMGSYRHDLHKMTAKYAEQCAAGGTTHKQLVKAANACKQHAELISTDHMIWIYAVGWAVVAFVVGFWYFHRAEERYGRG
ncbi:ABC transporter permease [Actinoallomurus rhizosphaericola]|uniref:ABC transporter permease n=1 Tax=Actinoallomurus rhizosphaericola TaxID=2952536 RepID=UPI0020910518|nr:ABC transporter permease [Actinoallomurus rhizosphaericola]MCO5993043.1 ABC transporter permease [Actinoallomurus rhizosphaericola]